MKRPHFPLLTHRLALLLVALGASGAAIHPTSTLAAPAATHANGDIPDSATYLVYKAPHFKIEFIEGWGRQTTKGVVTFSDKDSLERIALLATPRGSLQSFVRGPELMALRKAGATHIGSLRAVSLPGGHGWYVQYTIRSAADPVTGKVVQLLTDRYYLAGPHQLAVITLGSPLGDDNVDAFRRISRSFNWR